ncbi:hypothetical protein ACHAXR_008597 [Thalassiosira sp. AJA248-18]
MAAASILFYMLLATINTAHRQHHPIRRTMISSSGNTMNKSSSSNANDDGVIIGPDLNPTRSKMDKKLYRHITLSNGLKCVLICDTVAMRQRKLDGYYESDDDEDEEGGNEDVEDDEDEEGGNHGDEGSDKEGEEEEEEEEDDDDGLRKAATALLVNVGSYHDPPHLQGLAHYLEHMLFLGTQSFPTENAYDSFLSQQGGDDNAYTDMEHTLYHYCIPQDGSSGEKNVWKALEMFASFFICPLLGGDSAERELNAVESEFELNKKDDDCRWSQLMSYTCGMDENAPIMGRDYLTEKKEEDKEEDKEEEEGSKSQKKPFHPFAKFPWGDMNSLRTEPEAKGIDVMKDLRDFYHTHYYARNMRLVVMAGYELDEIQRRVVQHFQDVPANPRVLCNNVPTITSSESSGTITNLHPYKLPFHPSSLTKLYRIIPVRHHHTLTLTWQIPSTCSHWRTKPTDYLAHLLGHEAAGSILSVLKERGWAMSLAAGTGEDGLGDASTHALFGLQISLSKRGMRYWEDVVKIVFAYIGMLKFNFVEGHYLLDEKNGEKQKKVEGLAPWIYDELKSIAELSYRYADEGDVTDIVEEIAENMAPWYNLPEDRVLDGDALLFDDAVDNDSVKSLLFDYLTPENMRVDLMSSLFGRDADFGDPNLEGEEEKKEEPEDGHCAIQPMDVDDDNVEENGSDDDGKDPLLFDKEKETVEPRFGTKFWVEQISKDTIQQWTDSAKPHLPSSELAIDLPPKNSYVPKKFDIKKLPADDGEHPLLNCSVKVCVNVGRKKSWFPAAVTKYKTQKNAHRLSLSYEDEGEKWHVLDSPEAYSKYEGDEESIEAGHEGSLDGGKVKFRVTAVPREGEGIVFSYGDAGHDDDVEDGAAFPPIPPPTPESRLPHLIYDKKSVKVWHLQDRKFKRPLADLRMNVECEGMNDSSLNQACMALFCRLCADALTETCYLASVCELGSSLYPTDNGFSIRVHGFDDNLLALAKEVLNVVMSFRGRDDEDDLPTTIKDGRFDACLEVHLRKYSNAGMDASSFSTSLRLLCLRPSLKSSFSKAKALQGIAVSKFVQVISKLLKRVSVDAFYHGNVDRKDADEAANMISAALTCHHVGLPKKKIPPKLVIKTKHAIDHHQIVAPSIDPKDPNTAVEVYFQFGKDDNSSNAIQQRVLTDLLEHILEEPLYNQIRTKEQFGYEVSCGARWTYGVLGMSFRVVTSCKSADEASSRIEDFLKSFRSDLESMDNETFMEHLVGLAKNKLESFDSMEEETSSHWSEITEGRNDFEAYRKEVLCLRSLSKQQLIAAYDEWLHPLCKKGKPKKRRRMVLHVIGSGDGPASLGRPLIENKKAVGDEIDRLVQLFHSSVKHESWGRVTFGSPDLHRANTV